MMWIHDAIIGGYGSFRHEPASMRVCPLSREVRKACTTSARNALRVSVSWWSQQSRCHADQVAPVGLAQSLVETLPGQLNFIVVIALHWLSAELLGSAPAERRKVRHHRETNRHRPCADSRRPIWPTHRQQVQVGVHLRRQRDSR